jgi:Tol biopolymer transport system component
MENSANLVWATRAGARTPILEDISSSRGVSVSPDSQHVAFAPLDARSRSDVWVFNLARGTRVRLTTTNNSFAPLWTSDSWTVLFATGNSFFTKSIGGGTEQRLAGIEPGGLPLSLSPDGRAVLFERFPGDIFALPVDGSSAPTPFIASPSTERWAQFSPDGRWVAYSSNESGAPEIYVKRSGASPDRWQISLNGGLYPRWSRDGRELFFWNPGTIKMTAARLNISTTGLDVERIEPLFEVRPPDGFQRYFYDVTNDGRFIMEVASAATLETKLALTANWPSLLSTTAEPR